MGPRLSWISRYTTADDLLDDGVENFSDLKREGAASAAAGPSDPGAMAANQRHRERRRNEAKARPHLRSWSGVGLLLAVAMIAGGVVMLWAAPDMRVEHAAWKRARSSIEHVTPMRSRVYGVSFLLFGVALGYFSVARVRD